MRRRGLGGVATPGASISDRVRAIAAELDLALGRPERVAEECDRLRGQIDRPPTQDAIDALRPLGACLRARADPIADPVAALLVDVAQSCADPWPLLAEVLASRSGAHVLRAIGAAVRLSESGGFALAPEAVGFLALAAEVEGGPLASEAALREVGRLLRTGAAAPTDPVLALYLDGSPRRVRRLAARVLDLDGEPASHEIAARVLGVEAHAFLDSYLRYSRATHLDLLSLCPEPGKSPPALASLREAESVCGEPVLREVIAELGWASVNLGVKARPLVGVRLGAAPAFWVEPAAAPLLESEEEARRVGESILIVAHGGNPSDPEDAGQDAASATNSGTQDPVPRFRAYNLTHAEALAELLDLAPLTREKVLRILARMDRLVDDFVALFSPHTRECEILPGVYGDLRRRIEAELRTQEDRARLSTDLTRLVQMFEDPGSLGEVRTLHGLKRYLHQQGLTLGFRLVEAGRATNRRVDLALATRSRLVRAVKRIRYVDFEGEGKARGGRRERGPAAEPIPYPVDALAEAYGLHLLHGLTEFPDVKVFCYGNEVHYYATFGNHPAFLRVDYAPPLQGGMIDLEYYGVSKYVLAEHPNVELDAVQEFLHRLDFDVEVRNTRVHARYDKERALDLAVLCEKAEAVLRMIPFLMDLDWVIGDLRLSMESRRRVIEAWACRFERWGTLPVNEILTRDRQGIRLAAPAGMAGEPERRWSGEGEYRDRMSAAPTPGFAQRLGAVLAALGLAAPPIAGVAGEGPGQVWLERHVLRPLREAAARGEVAVGPAGIGRCPPDVFQREHEAEAFADLLEAAREDLAAAVAMARLAAPLERSVRFHTTGSVNGYEVQRARLTLRGGAVEIYVLRDAMGMARLAMFSEGESLWRRRAGPGRPWERNRSCDVPALAALLRRNSYLTPGLEPARGGTHREASQVRSLLRQPNPLASLPPLPGERAVEGLRVSPGRAAGVAVLGTAGRAPGDLDGAVLVAASVRPEDSPFLYRAAGVVTTGGSTLSHAALIAAQFRKPALVVPGRWEEEAGSPRCLVYRTLEYENEERAHGPWRIALRRDLREQEHTLREGDLLVLDADGGMLRVLGQGREALALHDRIRLHGDASRRLAESGDGAERLEARGRRLRTMHQLRKLLGRMAEPALSRHAVHEILLGEAFHLDSGVEKAQLLASLLANPEVAEAARDTLAHVAEVLSRRQQVSRDRALRGIPRSRSLYEVLALRLEALHLGLALDGLRGALHACGRESPGLSGAAHAAAVDRAARSRLATLREELARAAGAVTAGPGAASSAAGGRTGAGRLRHLVRGLERLDALLGSPEVERDAVRRLRELLESRDADARAGLADRFVIAQEESGLEGAEFMGWKAANLGEVGRLLGREWVPPWFAVTHRAFREVLERGGLREAIDGVLAQGDLTDAQKSSRIGLLWERARLPGALEKDIAAAYRRLDAPYVAVRSSAWEEDTEAAARAGEFDTFLFVHGEERVLECLKRAWSGLWTERAIRNRAAFGRGGERVGGGVIVQRIVDARISGVLQTVNLAEGEVEEIVINAGLGLGEGVVSGTVAADQIVVAKEGHPEHGPLRFRYVTADKRERVVFDRAAGFGTTRAACLHHQRLRPALEYTELCELVAAGVRLEAAYGHPLDMEFALEGQRLWILQARPVAAMRQALDETLGRHPLSGPVPVSVAVPAEETGH